MKTTTHPLRIWRKAKNLTLQQLKELAGVSVTPSHLSEIERFENTPSLDLAVKLSRATNGAVGVEQFVRGEAAE